MAQSFVSSDTSPIIMEHDHHGDDYEQGDSGSGSGSSGFGCGCFRLFCFGNQSSGDRMNFLQQTSSTGDQPHKERWLMKKLKELKEFSEVVAGPKWKNFIRKLTKKPKSTNHFQYDSQSYALNFNDADDHQDDEHHRFLARDFSTRFAPPFPNHQHRPSAPTF